MKKAISIKKKAIKKTQVFDEITDDSSEEDEPAPPKIKQVSTKPKQVVAQQKVAPQTQQPKYRFM